MADPSQGPEKKNLWVQMANYAQLAIIFPAATFVGWLIGTAFDRWLHTSWLYIVGLIVGIIAGFWRYCAQAGMGTAVPTHDNCCAASGSRIGQREALARARWRSRFRPHGSTGLLARRAPLARFVTLIPEGGRTAALRARSLRTAFVRQRDPDAAGRTRPRAPSASPAAA